MVLEKFTIIQKSRFPYQAQYCHQPVPVGQNRPKPLRIQYKIFGIGGSDCFSIQVYLRIVIMISLIKVTLTSVRRNHAFLGKLCSFV